VPLLVAEDTSRAIGALRRQDPDMLVWWATEVECVSALSRLERRGDLTGRSILIALERLEALADHWHEVQPLESIRRAAARVLRVHPLRAADALQLAAAVIACEGDPSTLELVSLDERLIEAARREGFPVPPVSGAAS